jgi:chemotaxis protein CheD
MLAVNRTSINVGLGELVVSNDPQTVLTCIGLGSCIALCAYDPVSKIGGLVHMLLPSCRGKKEVTLLPSKYIDTGTPLMIKRMIKSGANIENLIVKYVGGARMLSIPGENNHLDIGQRNIEAIKKTLEIENIVACGSDVGGGYGRSLIFYLDTGRIVVKAVSGRVIEL